MITSGIDSGRKWFTAPRLATIRTVLVSVLGVLLATGALEAALGLILAPVLGLLAAAAVGYGTYRVNGALRNRRLLDQHHADVRSAACRAGKPMLVARFTMHADEDTEPISALAIPVWFEETDLISAIRTYLGEQFTAAVAAKDGDNLTCGLVLRSTPGGVGQAREPVPLVVVGSFTVSTMVFEAAVEQYPVMAGGARYVPGAG
jgi:hypothetical protein